MGASTPEVRELFLQLEGLTESRIQVDKCNVLSDELANIISEGLDHTVRFDWDNSADNFTGDPYFTSARWEMRNQRDRKCWGELLTMNRDETLPGNEMVQAQMEQCTAGCKCSAHQSNLEWAFRLIEIPQPVTDD